MKDTIFDPHTEDHPMPPCVEGEAASRGVPQESRTTYVVYLTLDFAPGEAPYTPDEMADAMAGLWDDKRNPGKGDRQDVTVYTCKNPPSIEA